MIHTRFKYLRSWYIGLFCSFLFGSNIRSYAQTTYEFELPDIDLVDLQVYSHIQVKGINESSGIIKSRRYSDVFWTHNDSGNTPAIFPINRKGSLAWMKETSSKGIEVLDATNVDWEDMSYWKEYILIADTGNNLNHRKDLTIYIIKEPDLDMHKANLLSAYQIIWPDQKFEKDEANNFDCEAVFSKDSTIYFLSKNRADTRTKLYKLDSLSAGVNVPELISELEINGMVTAADMDPATGRLAVLTYNAIWLFEEYPEADFFEGMVRWLPIAARQCEAITFDDSDHLLITNEQEDIFRVDVNTLHLIKQ